MLRGIEPEQTRSNVKRMLEIAQEKGVPVLLFGMRAPPNMGAEYQQEFDALYPALAEEFNAALVPFFMAAVFDKPDLIQADRIHPTAQGIEDMVAATVGTVAAALPPVEG